MSCWKSYLDISNGSKDTTCLSTGGHFSKLVPGDTKGLLRRQHAAEREFELCQFFDAQERFFSDSATNEWEPDVDEIPNKCVNNSIDNKTNTK